MSKQLRAGQVCALFPAEEVDREQYPELLPAFGRALCVCAAQSREHATAIAMADETLQTLLGWLEADIEEDAVVRRTPFLETHDSLFVTILTPP